MTHIKSLIVIAGPTAIGKTAVSIAIANKLNCPVISADSRQFYKEMSIGTAKPTAYEMQDVPHYFIDSRSITEEYNVGKFETEAIALLEELFKTNKQVILVGGSGLYNNAVCNGFDKLPEAKPEIRKKIYSLFEENGIEGLQTLLKKLDPNYYQKVDLNNRQRISRALEVCITTGKPYSDLRKGASIKRNFNIIKIGLNTSRETLYARINTRVEDMMENGLLNEVRSLLPHKNLNALQTVGYKELFDHLENKTDLTMAIEAIKQNTRRFAKRQLTWFRKEEDMKWFEPNEVEGIMEYIKALTPPFDYAQGTGIRKQK